MLCNRHNFGAGPRGKSPPCCSSPSLLFSRAFQLKKWRGASGPSVCRLLAQLSSPRTAFRPSFVCSLGTSGSPTWRSHHSGVPAGYGSSLVLSRLRRRGRTDLVVLLFAPLLLLFCPMHKNSVGVTHGFFSLRINFGGCSSSSGHLSWFLHCHGSTHFPFNLVPCHDYPGTSSAEERKGTTRTVLVNAQNARSSNKDTKTNVQQATIDCGVMYILCGLSTRNGSRPLSPSRSSTVIFQRAFGKHGWRCRNTKILANSSDCPMATSGAIPSSERGNTTKQGATGRAPASEHRRWT